MDEKEVKGRQYLSAAEEITKSFRTLFDALIGDSSATEEAIELYIRAGNDLKMCHKWTEAGKAFSTASRLQWRSGQRHESALSSVRASNCFLKSDAMKAIECLTNAIAKYEDLGRLGFCARHHETIANIYRSGLKDSAKAVHHYEIAANYYKTEHSLASANKCLLRVADHLALDHDYERAIDIYEEVGQHCIQSPLLRYVAPKHFAKASLTHLCVDPVNGELALKRYEDLFPAFSQSREYQTIRTLIDMIENQSSVDFQTIVKTFSYLSQSDDWFESVLQIIANKYNKDVNDLDMK